jgi:hypothetical protein
MIPSDLVEEIRRLWKQYQRITKLLCARKIIQINIKIEVKEYKKY